MKGYLNEQESACAMLILLHFKEMSSDFLENSSLEEFFENVNNHFGDDKFTDIENIKIYLDSVFGSAIDTLSSLMSEESLRVIKKVVKEDED